MTSTSVKNKLYNLKARELINKYRQEMILTQVTAEGIKTTAHDVEILVGPKLNADLTVDTENSALTDAEHAAQQTLDIEYSKKDLRVIENLNAGWLYIKRTLDEPLTTDYVLRLHAILSKGLLWGTFSEKSIKSHYRLLPVRITNSKYHPSLRFPSQSEKQLTEIIANHTDLTDEEYAVGLYPQIAKKQFFADVNKRTALLIANKALLQENLGLLKYPSSRNQMHNFGLNLNNYYESEETLSNFRQYLIDTYLVKE